MRKTLEIVGKPMRYRTRMLQPGDTFTCSEREAKVWLRSKRVREARPMADIPPPPADLVARFDPDGDGRPGGSKAPPASDELAALRAEYTAKLGKRPFPGWSADVLREKIAANG